MRPAFALLALLLLGAAPPPPGLDSLTFEPHPGALLPLRADFRDQDGHDVRLTGDPAGPPMVLALGYFHCPNLCGIVRADLFNALGDARLVAGRDYVLSVVSIDPAETVADALAARDADLAAFPLPGARGAWRYLTGAPEAIAAVSGAVGFRDRADPVLRQFLHPAGIVVATPAGVVSGYLLGVGYRGADLRALLKKAEAGAVAAAPDPVLLLCFHYDPVTGRYSLAIMKVLRLAGLLTVLTIGGTLYLAFRRGHRA